MFDAHCHLSLMSNAIEVALDAERCGLSIFDCSVTPSGYIAAQKSLGAHENVRIGLGLHPWWIARGECGARDISLLCEHAASERFIGEIGLDFSKKGLGETQPRAIEELQLEAFRRLCRTLAENPLPHRVLSIHAVQSASCVLNILEEHGLVASTGGDARKQATAKATDPSIPAVILHWFSGTSSELARARNLGCYFSVSELMMRSRRGREYARQIPSKNLLLETDAPPQLNAPYSAAAVKTSLESALSKVAELKKTDAGALEKQIDANARALFGIDPA